ncbi:hypothetical protein CY34DRAFT_661664 [Suillus luteus UH-Slu-Lm8-n1]|uniref:Uncharacterized protein n=1 Tax=Suillus luteus UH-Slu-Lm8-n1 TaxID=930992 RepID=A0A0C9ZXE4_9AGAM|nr:hypothetical protein CY34DRAFT_661664 [Suillus luteus UH-Slu-Lm8-n1]
MHPWMSCRLIVFSTMQTRTHLSNLGHIQYSPIVSQVEHTNANIVKRCFNDIGRLVVNRLSQDLLPPTDIQPVPMHVYNGLSARAQSGQKIVASVQ